MQMLSKAALYSTSLSVAKSRTSCKLIVTKRNTKAGISPKASGLPFFKENYLHFFFSWLVSEFIQISPKFTFGAQNILECHYEMIWHEIC